MKYRNKYTGEVLEAFQYDGDMQNSDGEYYVPEWAVEALKTGKLCYVNMDAGGMPPLCLKTEEEDDFMIPQPEPKATREEAEKAWNERCENAERNL